MNRQYLTELADYTTWTNHKIIDWLSQIDNGQWEQAIPSSFSSVRNTTLHIASAQSIWIDFWTRRPNPVFLSTRFTGTKEELLDIWRSSTLDLQRLIDTWPEEAYATQICFQWRGEEWCMEFWQTFSHFINHATYHRGQLVTILRQVGFTNFTSTDLVSFFRHRQSRQ